MTPEERPMLAYVYTVTISEKTSVVFQASAKEHHFVLFIIFKSQKNRLKLCVIMLEDLDEELELPQDDKNPHSVANLPKNVRVCSLSKRDKVK